MGREAMTPLPHAKDALEVLGHQIRAERVAARLTQAQLAARAGVSARTLSLIEHGRPEPSIGNVFNVAAVLGMRLFGADPAELAQMHVSARRINSLIPQSVIPFEIDDDF